MKKDHNTQKERQGVVNSTKPGSKYRLRGIKSSQSIAALEEQLRLQDLISDISTIFINLPPAEVDWQIERGLKRIVEFLGIDRSSFGEFSEDKKELHATHSYGVPGIKPFPQVLVADLLPWYAGKLLSGEIVKIEDFSKLPEEAAIDKKYVKNIGAKSNLTIPVSIGGSMICGIAFGVFHTFRSWPDELVEQLKRVAEIFAQAVYRKRAEQKIQTHLTKLNNQFEFEKLVSDLSARFGNILPEKMDCEIVEGLKRVVNFLGTERSTLMQLSKDNKELVATHVYAVEGIKRIERIPLNEFPWATKKILSGETVNFSSVNDLPDEAAIDRETLGKLGLKSNITTPISVGGAVKYVLTAGAAKFERNWPEEIIPRLKVIGEIFVNALVRKENAEALQKNTKQLRSAYAEIERLSEQLKRENSYLQEEIKAGYHFDDVIGKSGGLKYIFYKIKQVASTDTTVLIEGETGSGKELVARALHEFSNRNTHPLIKVDCSSLPASMIESELFGHEKGAFTGANNQRTGRFELADVATIFLDEIGELPLELQTKLLRILQDGEFERMGSSRTIKINVRVIAATNRNLKEEVQNGNFREDLYYRLNVFPLSLPPLRERKEDIPALAESFVQKFNKRMGKNITNIPSKVLKALQKYSWPGNVRELENVIERAVITTEGEALHLLDFQQETQAIKPVSPARESLQERERNYIREVLEETYWRIEGKNGAAVILDLHPDTLRSRMKKLGIRRPTPSN